MDSTHRSGTLPHMTPADIAYKPVYPSTDPRVQYEGVTFRELAAMHICAALVSRPNSSSTRDQDAEDAVRQADALCRALANTP